MVRLLMAIVSFGDLRFVRVQAARRKLVSIPILVDGQEMPYTDIRHRIKQMLILRGGEEYYEKYNVTWNFSFTYNFITALEKMGYKFTGPMVYRPSTYLFKGTRDEAESHYKYYLENHIISADEEAPRRRWWQ